MNKIKLSGFSLLCAFCALALSACHNIKKEYASPVFPKTEKIASNRISSEGMILYVPFDMFVEGNYIYVLAPVEHKWLQVYDKQSGELVKQLLTEGQGPGELIMGTQLSYNADNRTLSIYDQAQRKHLFYRVNEDGELSFVKERNMTLLGLYGAIRQTWSLNENISLADGQLDSIPGNDAGAAGLKRFQLFSDGKIIARYDEFPVEEKSNSAYLGACISLSPDKSKIAVGTQFGAILETFNLSTDDISLRDVRLFYPAKLDPETSQPTMETIRGFASICTSNDKIYAAFGEPKTIAEDVNSISVFDWDANEVVRYDTDCNIARLYYSPKEPSKLYGIAMSKEREYYLVSFDLPEEAQ